ncbi:MAG TPA: glycosyltransferase, partial [Vicinamibacteria bacterium]|nr:glycosyltransferase [Vicinamibacteria bacterium]
MGGERVRGGTPPRVSVLLPVRDGEATLRECLASLFAQSMTDHEVLAVDDHSTDGSRALLEARAREDGRVRVFTNPGRGLVSALNAAASAARAPLLARMDADDVCHPDRLLAQAGRFQAEPGLGVLGTGVRLVGGAAANDGMRRYVDWLNGLAGHDVIVRDIYVESPLAHPTVMMRAETLRRLDGYREFDGPEDYDLWLRAHAAGARFGVLEAVLLDWRDGPGRLSRTDPRYRPERFRELKIQALEAGPLAGRAAVVWGAGPVGKGWCRALRARGHHVAAFVEVHPRRIGARIQGVPVVPVAVAPSLRGALHLAAVG